MGGQASPGHDESSHDPAYPTFPLAKDKNSQLVTEMNCNAPCGSSDKCAFQAEQPETFQVGLLCTPQVPRLFVHDGENAHTDYSETVYSKEFLVDALIDSGRPNPIPDFIPKPVLDAEMLTKQHHIIKDIWPTLTEDACKEHPEFCNLYQDVKSFNLPNFAGARRTVTSGLKLNKWDQYLRGYHDAEICYFLRYGWPVGYHRITPPVSVSINHPSALSYQDHILQFIKKELQHKAIVGPFAKSPFNPWIRLSPLMTRPKKDTDSRRVIIDLSFPHGNAVNDGIDIKSIFGRDTSYTLPTIGDLSTQLQKVGPNAWLWKADLARAYRQLRVDPLDVPLLGLQMEDKIYLDLCPSFGCRSSSSSCQRMAMALCYLMASKGWSVLAFLDDFAGIEDSETKAKSAYEDFLLLTHELGVDLATNKCAPPSKKLQWLGYDIDVMKMTVAIPDEKLCQVLDECNLWLTKTRVSKTMIQSIVGKLLHLAQCVKSARKFTTRILAKLRYMAEKGQVWTTVDTEFLADIRWFQLYAKHANGVALVDPILRPVYIECDSSLTGGGGNSETSFYSWIYSESLLAKYKLIHQLEAINLLVAYRTLCTSSATKGCCIVMLTDNLASSFALSTGKTKDPVLAACAREMWLEAAKADHTIRIEHRPGNLIPLADALSRAHDDTSKAALAQHLTQIRGLSKVQPKVGNCNFFTEDF